MRYLAFFKQWFRSEHSHDGWMDCTLSTFTEYLCEHMPLLPGMLNITFSLFLCSYVVYISLDVTSLKKGFSWLFLAMEGHVNLCGSSTIIHAESVVGCSSQTLQEYFGLSIACSSRRALAAALTHFGGDASQGEEIAERILSEVKFLENSCILRCRLWGTKLLQAFQCSSHEFLALLSKQSWCVSAE